MKTLQELKEEQMRNSEFIKEYEAKFLQKYGTYLGKSKACIKDLFSVKENAKQALNNESEE